VSETVLDAVARALQLDTAERTYLFELARHRPRRARQRPGPPQRVRPEVRTVLDVLDAGGSPAFVLNGHGDLLASNRMTRALITDFDALPYRDRNMVRFMFLDGAARELYGEWEKYAAEMVAGLRLAAGRDPDDRRLSELVGELTIKSPEFRAWWADHDVREKTSGVKLYHHPVVGDMTLHYENVTFLGDPGQAMCIYTAEPGSPSEAALRLLAAWAATSDEPRPQRPTRDAGRDTTSTMNGRTHSHESDRR
jgi:hypothetical protein